MTQTVTNELGKKWSRTCLIAAVKRHPMSGTSPVKIKPIAAELQQQHWGFTTAGFVLEPGTVLNSVSPISHSRTPPVRWSTQNVIMLLQKLFFHSLSISPMIMARRSVNDNYDINSWSLPESTTCPRGSLGRAGGRAECCPLQTGHGRVA